jgi:transcriptional regulator with XRE-family HTH domain
MLKSMSPSQCRSARALLDMTQPQLASLAGVGLSTIVDYERQRRSVSDDAINKLQLALEAAGITFINANGEGEGVRLRTPKR